MDLLVKVTGERLQKESEYMAYLKNTGADEACK